MTSYKSRGELPVGPMRWRRVAHWKRIRCLLDESKRVYAWIERGRRPNEYKVVFPEHVYHWNMQWVGKHGNVPSVCDPYVLTDSTLSAAKAVGILIAKSHV
jgi:hypothetical protein